MKTFRSMAAAAVVATGLLTAGCGSIHKSNGSPIVITSPTTSAISDVSITSVSTSQGLMDSYPALRVKLRVKNPTQRTVDYFVTLEYVNRAGTRIDVDYSSVEAVKPGQVVFYDRAYGGINPGDLHGISDARVIAVSRNPS